MSINKMSTEFVKKYFGVAETTDRIQITIFDKNGKNCGVSDSFKVTELLSPKYGVFEIIKKALDLYKECNFEAHLTSNIKDNYLMMLAVVYNNVDEELLEMWRKRYFAKFGRV